MLRRTGPLRRGARPLSVTPAGAAAAPAAEPRRVRPRRSALYMPGSRRRALEKARTLAADCIIMDCPLPSPPPFPQPLC